MSVDALRNNIADLVKEHAKLSHESRTIMPGVDFIPPSGKVVGAPEVANMVEASLDAWLTTGRFNKIFEDRLSDYIGIKHLRTVNSGSSANLVALATLTSEFLKDRALKPGDEIITTAAGFPTTLNPAILYGLVPVFLDVDVPTYNIDVTKLEEAITPKTRAIMIAHTLGNPFNLQKIMEVAEKHDLWVVEDCCDALGATYNGQMVGTFGDLGTLSFYPAHHITMGEGGAVFTNRALLKRIMESIRDWGRDCWCEPGIDNTCNKRFDWQLGDLPFGYDHKYTYSHLGYNLKITDMQAAAGVAQLDRLSGFVQKRRENFNILYRLFKEFEEFFILPEPTPNSDPSWFGFVLTLRENAPFSREVLMAYLNYEKKIGTRLLFAGNLVRQPYMKNRHYKVVGDLTMCDFVMNNTFWIGLYPALSEEHFVYMADMMREFLKKYV